MRGTEPGTQVRNRSIFLYTYHLQEITPWLQPPGPGSSLLVAFFFFLRGTALSPDSYSGASHCIVVPPPYLPTVSRELEFLCACPNTTKRILLCKPCHPPGCHRCNSMCHAYPAGVQRYSDRSVQTQRSTPLTYVGTRYVNRRDQTRIQRNCFLATEDMSVTPGTPETPTVRQDLEIAVLTDGYPLLTCSGNKAGCRQAIPWAK
jgi:hypothetical protein